MARRFVVNHLHEGTLTLDERQANHLRNVLRMEVGDAVELIDASGATADARIIRTRPDVELAIQTIARPAGNGTQLIVAAATPKGSRADWMIEKLSELGVDTYIPLEASRSVVHPEMGKRQRWMRISEESAKQCKRRGVMDIADPASVEAVAELEASHRLCLSTEPQARPVVSMRLSADRIVAAVGPEGGWTPEETALFRARGFEMASLTETVLRVETAAIAIASIIMCNTKENR